MKIINIIFIILLASCNLNSSKDTNEFLRNFPTRKAIFQKKYESNDSICLDTLEIGYENNNYLIVLSDDLERKSKSKLYYLSKFDFENKTETKVYINLNPISDSIKYIDTSYSNISESKSFKLDGDEYEIIKQGRTGFLQKSPKPSYFEFFNSKFGYLASIEKGEKRKLLKYTDEELSVNHRKLIDKLEKDGEFYNFSKSED